MSSTTGPGLASSSAAAVPSRSASPAAAHAAALAASSRPARSTASSAFPTANAARLATTSVPLVHLARLLPLTLADDATAPTGPSATSTPPSTPSASLPAVSASASSSLLGAAASLASPATPTSSSDAAEDAAATAHAHRIALLESIDRTGTHAVFLTELLSLAVVQSAANAAQRTGSADASSPTASPSPGGANSSAPAAAASTGSGSSSRGSHRSGSQRQQQQQQQQQQQAAALAQANRQHAGLLPLIAACLQRALTCPTPVWYTSLAEVLPRVAPTSDDVQALTRLVASCGIAVHEQFVAALAIFAALASDDPAVDLVLKLISRGSSVFRQVCETSPPAPALDEYIHKYSTAALPLIARRLLSASPADNDLDAASPTMSQSDDRSIAALLRKAGYLVLYTPDVFHGCLVAHMGNARAVSGALSDPVQLGRALATMAMTHSDLEDPVPGPWTPIINATKSPRSTWDLEVFVTVVNQYGHRPDWAQAVKCLDVDGFQVRDLRGFELIVDVYRRATKSKFPIHVLFDRWHNAYAQFTIVAHSIQAPPDKFNFADYPANETRKVVTQEELVMATSGSGRSVPITALPNQALNSLDVLDTMLALLDHPECTAAVKEFIHNASAQAPELLLLGLAQLLPAGAPASPDAGIHGERVISLTKEFLLGKPTSAFVLPRLWTHAPATMVACMVELHREDSSRLRRLLDVCQDLKVLGDVLKRTPLTFALDLAALASHRSYLNLELWVPEMIHEHGEAFARACVEYVKVKLNAPNSPLTNDTAAHFVAVLSSHGSGFSPDLAAALASLSLASDKGESGFHRDFEEQSMRLFDMFYKEEMLLLDFINHLVTLRNTQDKASQGVFACTVTTFMEEAKFFHTYPDRNLTLSADFLGQLIAHGLLPTGGPAQGGGANGAAAAGGPNLQEEALKFILESLSQPETTKMFHFGLRALGQFLPRVSEFQSFAKQLVTLPGLVQTAPEIIQLVQEKLPSKPFKALVVDPTLTGGLEHMPPSDQAKDRILFLINNLSQTNLEAKVADARALLTEAYYRWFSEYLVRVRAAVEPNFQPLYVSFLRAFASRTLDKCILYDTYVLTEAVLNSDRTAEAAPERAKLKNIGAWLGALTLGQDRPIKHKHLAIKELLLEGYDHQRLMVVVPFVCQVLQQAKHSSVFVPPNPWLMAILGLLVELYHFADIKLNLKFEIEVLCKSIAIELSEVKPTELLRARRLGIAAPLGLPGAADLAGVVVPPGIAGPAGAAGGALVPGGMGHPPAGFGGDPHAMAHAPNALLAAAGGVAGGIAQPVNAGAAAYAHITLQNLASFIVFIPTFPIHAKRLVHVAFDRAIRETLGPVVERSVTIAAISTRELVLKDFATEGDEVRVRTAAHLMGQQLAGSLALVTCKDPLRLNMGAYLRSMLMQNGVTEQQVTEQHIHVTVADNLEIGCRLIERAAMEKVIPELDEQLAPALMKRKQVRDVGKTFYELPPGTAAEYRTRLAGLPDVLRLKVGGLTPQQFSVYEEYSRMPYGGGHGGLAGMGGFSRGSIHSGMSGLGAGAGGEDGSEEVTLQQSIDRFTKAMADLESHLASVTSTPSMYATLPEVPATHEMRVVMRQVPQLLPSATNASRDDLALMFCTKVIQPLYSATSDLAREVYAVVLRDLCSASIRAGREVVQWLLYAEDERKYNVAATAALIKAQLLLVADVDAQLARLIEAGKNLIEYAIELVAQTTGTALPASDATGAAAGAAVTNPAIAGIATPNDWFNTVDVLHRLVMAGKAPESVKAFIVALRQRVAQNAAAAADEASATALTAEALQLREQLTYTFAEWLRLLQHPNANEAMFRVFIGEMQRSVIYSNDDTFCLFFRVCTELSIDAWLKAYKVSAGPAMACQAIDAFAKLVILLTKYHDESHVAPAAGGETNGSSSAAKDGAEANGTAPLPHQQSRLAFFNKIVSIIVLVLVAAHETQQRAFNQRPYFRLLSSLLYELNAQEAGFQPVYFYMLQSMAETIHTLQPMFLPGFAFSWLTLVAHRQLMPKLLLQEERRGWPMFSRLLLALFRFLVPFLREGWLREPTLHLYRGTLRVLLVLLHDFPEFLCEYYYALCAVIPSGCLQLRNLILSAFPRTMRLPDPFTFNLRMDMLPDTSTIPVIPLDALSRTVLDAGLSDRAWDAEAAVAKLRLADGATDEITGSTYNVALISALVLLAGNEDVEEGAAAAAKAAAESGNESAAAASGAGQAKFAFFRDLLARLDSEGRYLVLSAIANHLRYPNAHTRYFSGLLLFLFAQKDLPAPVGADGKPEPASSALAAGGGAEDALQEQITRVLLERLIANRPHPWGLLVTFIELIKGPQYTFWEYGFTRCAPDIERLFKSVSRSVNHH
ncbi:CCR4-NOT core subunit cdc39 [Blastocladiella emersonii ATCC 22665]|nr:CCR4-NOT core subunit cdc39 [Blastocladiella emersonii ATCC 22665]